MPCSTMHTPLQPDITGPGVNILAAWSPVATTATGGRSVDYNIISGTSMSCPHASAIAAILKSYHPSWSPAAIKSAIMTTGYYNFIFLSIISTSTKHFFTSFFKIQSSHDFALFVAATVLDNTKRPIRRDPNDTVATPFDFGSGHVNPVAAVDPGLIYDFDTHDIINFLCSTGASPLQFKNLTGKPINCKTPPIPSYNFNYPSIGVSSLNGSLSVYRTVTYYGDGPTVYVPYVDFPTGVNIAVYPSKLKFSKTWEKKTFRVDLSPIKSSNGSFVFGALTWSNAIHSVRSPIALNVV